LNVNQNTGRNYCISILRVLGMLFIILCHIASWLDIAFLEQFFNYGVYIFLFISGFLYANKEINSPSEWFLTRVKKLLIPFYLFVIPVSIVYFKINGFDGLEAIKYLFCLQGINFITPFIPFSEIKPLGNLWFVTIILICYLLTILVKKIEKKHKLNIAVIILILVAAWFIPKIMMCFNIPYISLEYFVTYFLGYYISKFKVKNTLPIFIIYGLFLFLASIGIRLVGKYCFDNSINNFYLLIVSATHLGLAVSTYFICNYLVNKFTIFIKIAKSIIWITFDKLSYPIYITHYAFLNSVTSVDNFGLSKPISFILFILMTITSALIIFYIDKAIQNKIIRT